jgi:tripartite-type tricarboxylate transporter receptor subunit TctC
MKRILQIAILAITLGAAASAAAQTYPAKPIRLIVGFAPGGGTDYVGRAIGQKLSDALGQPVLVENRPGNSSMVANEMVAKSPADGYTLLVAAAGAMTIAPNINTNVGFDTFKDFEPIALVVTSPYLLTLNPSVQAKTLAEFTALAKANPGKLNFASSGTGGAPHLAGELYKRLAGVDLVHVPYKGLAPAITDLLGGQVQVVFADINLVLKHIEAGKLKALAITGGQRFAALPDVPTMAEAGLPGYQAQTWYGLVAPAGTPAAVIKRLHAETSKALAAPEMRSQFATQGLLPASASATPADFAALMRSDFDKWRKLIKEAGIKPN